MKIAGVCLTLVMLAVAIGMFAITVSAADDITVTIDTGASVTLKDADHDGYYDIGNADELYAYAVIMNSKNYISAELTANVTVNEGLIDKLVIAEDGSATPVEGTNIRLWTPINSTTNEIDVDFEGNGYEISGLYCNSEAEGVGLFGVFQSPDHFIQNLGVVDSYFCGESSVGAIIGETINRTYVHNCYSNAIVKGTDYVGGLVGSLDNGAHISQSYFIGDVYGSRFVGGLTGYIYSVGTIGGVNESYFVGNVYGKDIVGGIAGYASQSGALLSACYVYGTVSFESGKYGGVICGTVYNTDRVGHCYYNTDLFEGPAVAYSQSSNIKTTYGVDSETFASGKVAYDMQSTLNGYFVWGQEIGTDKYPVFVNDTNTVYKNQIGGCTRKTYVYEYSNTEQEAVITHQWNEGEITVQPTCTTPGTKVYTCLCDSSHTKTEELGIDKEAHSVHVIWYNSKQHIRECELCFTVFETEDHSGGDGSCMPVCEICDEVYKNIDGEHKNTGDWTPDDNNANVHFRTCFDCGSRLEEDHKGGEATCISKVKCEVCDVEYGEFDLNAHDIVTDPPKAPTCEESGLTEGSHCTRCDGATVEQTEIPTLGHDIVMDEGYAPTCIEKGLTEGQHCSRCDGATVEQTEIPVTDHDWHAYYVEPTCTEDGGIVDFCTECGYNVRNPGDQVPALGHSYVDGICKRCEDVKTETDTDTNTNVGTDTENNGNDGENGNKTGGCGSSIGLGAIAIACIFGAALVFKKKK